MMTFRKRHPPVGSRPGTLVIGADGHAPVARVMDYTLAGVTEHEAVPPSGLDAFLASGSVSWIDVHGLGDEATLRAIGDALGLHALVLEDIVNVPQRPKTELHEAHHLIVLRMAMLTGNATRLEQVSLLVGNCWVATFQEQPGDVFDPVRRRIREGRGPIRGANAGYLAYALIDTIIDEYYPILEHVGDRLDALQDEVMEQPGKPTLRRIYAAKRQLVELRRAVWPHRDTMSALLRDESRFIDSDTRLYLRDVHDHAVQQLDVLESFRDTASGFLDVYLSSESNRTNEVMRVLTVMASIFIPLTFIAGVYGMNFQAMPELHSSVGYPLVLLMMIVIAAGMLFFFHRKGWLGERDDGSR